MGDRVILHSDINSCYASIELLHHPELRGKPLAVGGDPEARHGIVLTADYVAKKHGVKTGVNTDELVHTARSSSACFPLFQCTLSAS